MAYILVVHHSPSDRLRMIADTVLDAAREACAEVTSALAETGGQGGDGRLEVRERRALEPDAEELLGAAGVILGTSANFGYISGALKHYFDSTFAAAGPDGEGASRTKDLPFSYWIRGGYDTTGAEKAMEAITTGFGWGLAADPVVFTGDPEPRLDSLRDMAQNTVGAVAARL
ncbi:flavodoxin [Corynebacterium bovis]|uniref:Flavodoxin n=3 Tax=Corynebacterium bovis TaxID=36808 RepID=A0A3R8QNM9_9CORY|nr:flavodoxin [Corynebacterium bovis]MBB3116131.1 multimeric flavodoxin WrbA [Corynebacterium bovis DSM 20582 = CIP 54.80]QQC47057.1 flavodoxin family protein [Corynebacterium bovis]RRO78959.1 flavodoxin [Corynebacterium bovis]RRO79959.1 flavodoxin [Corynebacterium bovis]RRO81847.1 flavodoxin [Corynebacterium bovis]